MTVDFLGWDTFFEEQAGDWLAQGYAIGRIIRDDGQACIVSTSSGTRFAELTGKFRFELRARGDSLAVGDWVILQYHGEDAAVIHGMLKRRTQLSRKSAGQQTTRQVLAANIDTVFIVSALDREFNVNRIERYLLIVNDSGAEAVVLLNKSDKCRNPEKAVREVNSCSESVPVLVMSAQEDNDFSALHRFLGSGRTAAFIGSSGVGKSTIINCLAGTPLVEIGDVREYDDRGRHTTSFRSLLVLPDGGMVIDTPGMREIQLWLDSETLASYFTDIESLAVSCRFRDCRHEGEPDCAVLVAVEQGVLARRRLGSYCKMRDEIDQIQEKQRRSRRK